MPDELRATGVTPETADHNKQISDYGFDLGGPIVARPGVVLRLLLGAGRPAGAPRRRAGRPDAAEEPEREGELAGDQEGHGQLPLLRRVQDQGRPQPRHRPASCSTRRPRRSTRTTPTPTSRCTACGSSPTTASSARTCSCRRSTRTTTPASCSTPDRRHRPAGGPQLHDRRSRSARSARASTSGRRRSSTST